MKHWLIVAVILTAGAVARQSLADQPPGGDPTNKPATPAHKADAKSKAKAPAKKPAATAEADRYVPVTEPGPAIVRQNNVNVRGQAAINSEVIAHLKKGDKVTVLEEVTIKKPKTDEPAKWARIALPSGTPAWVHSSFIDTATKAVKVKKLNLRSGPGENYSVIGHLEKGAPIKEIETKGEWIKIEAPEKSAAFVAAHLLSKDVGAASVAAVPPPTPVPPPRPPPTPVAIAALPPPAPTPVPPVDNTVPPPVPPPIVAPPPPVIPPPTPAAPEEEIIVRRVVTREGVVKGSVSIQAPTYYVLKSLDNGRTINYLHTTSTNVLVNEFWNQKVLVTGEESLDERWPNTPVLTIESIQAEP
ncbi:MAG TPA: SH3 domain-containing protein [Verrucomicrobiae bacterium]